MAVIIIALGAGLALYSAKVDRGHVSRRMSEGIAGCGSIRTGFRVYAAGHAGNYPVLKTCNASQLGVLGIVATDLDGKYFKATDYKITSTATTYTIKATLPGTNETYILNQAGIESGTYRTGS